MPKTFYRDVVREVRKLGWERVAGGKGSHERFTKEGKKRKLTIPFNLYSRNLANAILRDAGSSKRV